MEVGGQQILRVTLGGAIPPVKAEWKLDNNVIDTSTQDTEADNYSFSYLISATKPMTGAVSCRLTDGLNRVAHSTVATLTIKDKAENG